MSILHMNRHDYVDLYQLLKLSTEKYRIGNLICFTLTIIHYSAYLFGWKNKAKNLDIPGDSSNYMYSLNGIQN